MNKTIYFIRHGETDFNKERIVQGSGVDSSLNDLGRQQGKAFFEKYKTIDFDVVISSKLQRTHQTIKPFIDTGLKWEQYGEINEINWGVHEGKKSSPDMINAYKAMIKEWGEGNLDARLEEGESAAELSERLRRFFDHVEQRPEKNILVCTHGRTLRCIMCLLKKQDLGEMENYRHSNTGLFLVHYKDGAYQVALENDTSHLEA